MRFGFMIKIKKNGFTLPEVLITLTIVGALAALVLPGLIKNTQAKAMMALLQGTVANLNDAVQAELIRSGATNIKDTLMYTDKTKFLKDNLDVKKVCSPGLGTQCYGAAYKTYSGGNGGLGTSNSPVLLKNGVAIDLFPNDADNIMVSIDLNGGKEPNIIGVDLFYLYICGKTDLEKGIRMGDLRGLLQNNDISDDFMTVTNAQLKQLCNRGLGTPCYLLAERSGFDPEYMDKNY